MFKNSNIILSRRQPKNLSRFLCNKTTTQEETVKGVNPCSDKRCQLCTKKFIVKCDKIHDKNNIIIFHLQSQYTCNSKNVIYVLQCASCNELYVGQTENLRNRMNLHKSHVIKVKTGHTEDNILPCSKHFAECNTTIDGNLTEPYFHIIPFWHCNIKSKRLRFEEYFITKFQATLNV